MDANANREYANGVFTLLFDDIERLLSLYNALSGNNLPPDTPVKIVTLKDVLFKKRRNDIAFVIEDKFVILVEHQSTINENMPLRLLIYVARLYEKLIENKAIYKMNLLKIPKPDFIVLYNGTDPFPKERTLRLSDAFKEHPEALAGLGGSLELDVRVLNINEGYNVDIVQRSEELFGYVKFISKVRKNRGIGMELDAAINEAVHDCINEGILAEFFEQHASEVRNMLTEEWNDEAAQKVAMEEGEEIGEKKGIEKGKEIGREEGKEIGREEGKEIGREEGKELGVGISAEIIPALIKQEPIEDISVKYNVSIEKVKDLQSALAMYVAEPH